MRKGFGQRIAKEIVDSHGLHLGRRIAFPINQIPIGASRARCITQPRIPIAPTAIRTRHLTIQRNIIAKLGIANSLARLTGIPKLASITHRNTLIRRGLSIGGRRRSRRTCPSTRMSRVICVAGRADADAGTSVGVGERRAVGNAQVGDGGGGRQGRVAGLGAHVDVAIPACGAHCDAVVGGRVRVALLAGRLARCCTVLSIFAGAAVCGGHAVVRGISIVAVWAVLYASTIVLKHRRTVPYT